MQIGEQETTDFEKSLYSTRAPVTVALGMTGRRFDHTLAALDAVAKYAAKRKIVLVDEEEIAEAILLMRRIPQKNAECHRGGWSKSAAGSFEVRDKVLGIVGYGHISTQVGLLAEALGMRVIYHDIETKLALGNACMEAELHRVDLRQATASGEDWLAHAVDAFARAAALRPGDTGTAARRAMAARYACAISPCEAARGTKKSWYARFGTSTRATAPVRSTLTRAVTPEFSPSAP